MLPNPPVLWDIESDPMLAGTKLIAEAWDAAGLYQVGSFVGDSWKEWNGRFRDDIRDFFRGADGSLKRFADRMMGSPEIYGHKEREASRASTLSLVTTGSRSMISFHTTTSTTKPTARRIAMARTTTGAGTAASKARAMIPPSRNSATGRLKLSHGQPALAGPADDPHG